MELVLENFFDTKYHNVSWDTDNKIIVTRWKAFATSTQFREVARKRIELIKTKKAKKMLLDLSLFRGITPSDQIWMREINIPNAIHVGMNRIAVISPDDIFGKASFNNIWNKIERDDILYKTFTIETEAINWLHSL